MEEFDRKLSAGLACARYVVDYAARQRHLKKSGELRHGNPDEEDCADCILNRRLVEAERAVMDARIFK